MYGAYGDQDAWWEIRKGVGSVALTSDPGRRRPTTDLASLGWDAAYAATYTEYAPSSADHRPGRVACAVAGICTVLTSTGAVRASLAGGVLACAARDLTVLPCAGDWVVLRTWPDRKVTVEAVLPRRATVLRRTTDARHLVAANVDVAAVVEPATPEPDADRLARLAALAGESGARVLVLLSKADLAPDPAAVVARLAGRVPNVTVSPVSVARPESLAALRPLVAPGRTLALLGAAGAGRSSLVNALAGTPVMVGRRDGPVLVPLPGRGAVVDAPESWHPTDLREGPLLRVVPA